MSAIVQSQQLREALYGVTLTSPVSVVPNVSPGTLWTVSGGPVRITSVIAIVTTAFTATATTLNLGTAGGPTSLFNAAVLTSLAAGSVLIGIPTTQTPVVAASGAVTWQASVANTGQLQVYLSYIPVTSSAVVQ